VEPIRSAGIWRRYSAIAKPKLSPRSPRTTKMPEQPMTRPDRAVLQCAENLESAGMATDDTHENHG